MPLAVPVGIGELTSVPSLTILTLIQPLLLLFHYVAKLDQHFLLGPDLGKCMEIRNKRVVHSLCGRQKGNAVCCTRWTFIVWAEIYKFKVCHPEVFNTCIKIKFFLVTCDTGELFVNFRLANVGFTLYIYRNLWSYARGIIVSDCVNLPSPIRKRRYMITRNLWIILSCEFTAGQYSCSYTARIA